MRRLCSQRDRCQVDEEAIREMLAAGRSAAEIAARLVHDDGLGPIAAIKLLRDAGIELAAGKRSVDASLPRPERLANERLRDLAGEALVDDDAST